MRLVIALAALIALAVPSLALDWGRYANPRFGYAVEIPPKFAGRGESADGDGQVFVRADRNQQLLVWGGPLAGDFEAEARARQIAALHEGWNLTDMISTPGWATFSAVRGERMMHHRVIAICGGAVHAGFTVEYAAVQAADMAPYLARLARTLRPSGDC